MGASGDSVVMQPVLCAVGNLVDLYSSCVMASITWWGFFSGGLCKVPVLGVLELGLLARGTSSTSSVKTSLNTWERALGKKEHEGALHASPQRALLRTMKYWSIGMRATLLTPEPLRLNSHW